MQSFHQDDPISEINVTPLVDVMLVLLILFMVTAPLLSAQSLKVDIPKTAKTPQSASTEEEASVLIIHEDGLLNMDGENVTEAKLAEQLKVLSKVNGFHLKIQADKRAPYGLVAQSLALAQASGVTRLSFLTLVDE